MMKKLMINIDKNSINDKRSKICTFLLIGAEFDVSSSGISS